jgi:competence protein ComEA
VGPDLRGALSRAATRAIGSRFAKPIARVVLATAGLLLLAFVGRTAVAGALGTSEPSAAATAMSTAMSTATSTSTATPTPTATSTPVSTSETASHVAASKDDPVVLNTATTEDLRRLPGIGEKRATAILALRARLGRFRAVEDLLKVKGIGRATLRRLRPMIRIDPSPVPDAGAQAPAGG